MRSKTIGSQLLAVTFNRPPWVVIPLLVAPLIAHAHTVEPLVDPPRPIQSSQEVPICGTGDLATKAKAYTAFILEFGREYDAKQAGKESGPYVDWQKPDHHYLRISDEEWTYAYQIFIDAYNWASGRVTTPVAAIATDSPRAGLDARARITSTLPTGLALYNYTVRRLREKLDANDMDKLDVFMEEMDHPCTLPDASPQPE